MPSNPPQRIQLGETVLRRQRLGDEDMVAIAVRDSLQHLQPWMPWATPEAASVDAQRRRLSAVERWWEAGSDYTYTLLNGSETNVLGSFGLHRRVGPRAIELGYWLAPDAVGHGYATAAAEALTSAAMSLPDVARVEIHCDEANVRSQAIPRRLGYRLDRVEEDEIEAPADVGRSMLWIFPGMD